MGHSCELIDTSMKMTNKQADLGCFKVHVCPIAKGYLLQINIKKN